MAHAPGSKFYSSLSWMSICECQNFLYPDQADDIVLFINIGNKILLTFQFDGQNLKEIGDHLHQEN